MGIKGGCTNINIRGGHCLSCVQRSDGDSRDLQDVDKHGEYESYTCNERTTLLKAGQLKPIPELCRGCSKPHSVAQGHGSARAPRCPPASPREGQGTHGSGEVGRRAEKPPHLSVETGPHPKRHGFCKQAHLPTEIKASAQALWQQAACRATGS